MGLLKRLIIFIICSNENWVQLIFEPEPYKHHKRYAQEIFLTPKGKPIISTTWIKGVQPLGNIY